MSGSALLLVETDWPVSLYSMDAGVGYYQITTGVATDDDDFIVGGTGGLGIAPANGDIGELVKSYSITRGRSSELDRPTAGMATIVVDNPSAVFSPLNTTGCLSGSLLPRRSLSIAWRYEPGTAGAAASKFYRFTGRITRITPEPTVEGGRQAVITAIDDFNEMQRLTTRSTLYQDVKSGCLAASLLTDAGYFSSCRSIADGQDTYTYAYFERRKLDEVLVDIERTEYGFMYVRGDGALVFHDRHYRSTTLVVSASFIDTMSRITYSRSDDGLSTEAEVPYNPKTIEGDTTIWTLQDPLSIAACSTASFFGNYLDPNTCQLVPAFGVASPVFAAATAPAACFYSTSVASLGTATHSDMSASFTAFAESFKFAASNGGSATNWLTGLTTTGCPLVGYEESTARWLDATACGLYGLRTLTYGGQNLIHTSDKARDFAQFLVNRFKDPQNLDESTLTIHPKNDTLWEQILRREIDDRIAVTNSVLGISGQDFFIGKINEEWSVAIPMAPTVTWELERATAQNDFVADYSLINSSDGWGY